MSLSTATPEPRRGRAASKPRAAKKAAPRRAKSTAESTAKSTASPFLASSVDAERLFRRFVQLLPDGDHPFSQLREQFSEWCAAGDVTSPTASCLSTRLTNAGLMRSRRGRKKVTTFTKQAARLAA